MKNINLTDYAEEIFKPIDLHYEGDHHYLAELLHKPSGRTYWLDVTIKDQYVTVDWNQYIFQLNDPEHVARKALQEEAGIFDEVYTVIIDYLEHKNVIK